MLKTKLTERERAGAAEMGLHDITRDLEFECDVCDDVLSHSEMHEFNYRHLCKDCLKTILKIQKTCEGCEYYRKNHIIEKHCQHCDDVMYDLCPAGGKGEDDE